MKIKKILSFLLIFLFLFSLFLIPSEAASVSVPQYYIDISETVEIDNTFNFPARSITIDPFNSENEYYTTSYTYPNYNKYDDINVVTSFSLYTKDGSPFLRKGGTSTLDFSGVWLGGRFDFGTTQKWTGKSYLITVKIYYPNGSVYIISYSGSEEDIISDYNTTTRLHNFIFSFLPENNVYRIDYICEVNYAFSHTGSLTYNYRLGEYDDPVSSFSLKIDQEDYSAPSDSSGSSDDSGLLDGIKNFFASKFGGFWDYFDTFIDYLNSLKSLLTNAIPFEIKEGFRSLWDYWDDTYGKLNDLYMYISVGINNKLVDFKDKIVSLPTTILDGIQNILIPDVETLEKEFNALIKNIGSQIGIHFDTYDRLFDTEVAPEDVYEDYNIPGVGTLKLKFLDTSYLIEGVAFFRPIIRGFLVLLLVFYNWKQALTLFDQNPAIAGGAIQGLASHQESTQMKIDL